LGYGDDDLDDGGRDRLIDDLAYMALRKRSPSG
jgi:hypothetical protein